jgi:hypothetical protein
VLLGQQPLYAIIIALRNCITILSKTAIVRTWAIFDRVLIRYGSHSLITIIPIRIFPHCSNAESATSYLSGLGHSNFAATAKERE